jgi:hypothetical protein
VIGDRPLSALDAEKVLGIPAATVRSWYHRRGRTGLHAVGLDGKDNPMFYESDLIALRRGEQLRDEHGARLGGAADE